jgi:hypothetical protein
MRATLLTQIVVALLAVTHPANAQQVPSDIRSRVAGKWRWEQSSPDCKNNHVISFSTDGRLMLLTSFAMKGDTGEVTEYEILGTGANAIRGRIVDETRRTDQGEIVVWDLILFEQDRYCWRRTDWPTEGCTQPVVRCGAQPDRGSSPGRTSS